MENNKNKIVKFYSLVFIKFIASAQRRIATIFLSSVFVEIFKPNVWFLSKIL